MGQVAGQEVQQQDLALEQAGGALDGAVGPHIGELHGHVGRQAAFDPAQVLHQPVEREPVRHHDLDRHVHAVRTLKHRVERRARLGADPDPVARRHQAEPAGGIRIARPLEPPGNVRGIAFARFLPGALKAPQASGEMPHVGRQRRQQHQPEQPEHPAQARFPGVPAAALFALAQTRPRAERGQFLFRWRTRRHQLRTAKRVTDSGSQSQYGRYSAGSSSTRRSDAMISSRRGSSRFGSARSSRT